MQTKKTVRNGKARRECRFLLVETHKHLTSITALAVHANTSLLYTFQRSMQANRNINLWSEKAPIYRSSRSKAPKTQQICNYKHTRKTNELFYCLTRASTLVSSIISQTQVPLRKFPFLFIIPCLAVPENSSCLLIWQWLPSGACNSKNLTCINKHIPIHHSFACVCL